MEKQLTIRGVPVALARKLERLSRERGLSVNATVLGILHDALDVSRRRERLARYATWTAEEVAQMQDAIAAQREIDESLWR